MSRLRADILLLIAALIWGTAFIAQKFGNDCMPPVMFTGVRFLLASLAILPLARIEAKTKPGDITRRDMKLALAVGVALFFGIVMQQMALLTITVTNTGFLTMIYIVFTPFAAWLVQGIRPRPMILAACAVALAGGWLLAGHGVNDKGASVGWTWGDILVLGSDIVWAFQIVFISKFLERTHRPFFLSFVQYGVTGVLAVIIGLLFEPVTRVGIMAAMPAIVYGGLFSGGFAYTFQIIGQRHTPAAEAALILSLEGVFAALAGAAIFHERLTFLASVGCGLILLGILLAEVGPVMRRRR